MHQQGRGFTLVELVVAVTIVAILFTVAVPGFQELLADNRLSTTLNRLNATLQSARSEAIRTGNAVVVCKSPDGRNCATAGGWEQGWMAFQDPNGNERCQAQPNGLCDDGGQVVERGPPVDVAGVTLRSRGNTADLVVYTGMGTSAGYFGTFSACDERGVDEAHGIVLWRTGRIRRADPENDNVVCP